MGTTVKFGIDATRLYTYFKDERFKRLHFNCPFSDNAEETRELVCYFFNNAKKLQQNGDRIHMFLKESNAKRRTSRELKWNLGRTYDIFLASAKAGYVLKDRRKFDTNRYPEYKHRVTTGNKPAKKFYGSEYIFEKKDKTFEQIEKECNFKLFLVRDENGDYYYLGNLPSRKEESSSYSDNDPKPHVSKKL